MRTESKAQVKRAPARVLKLTLAPYLTLLALVGGYLCWNGFRTTRELQTRLLPLQTALREMTRLDHSVGLAVRLSVASGDPEIRETYFSFHNRLLELLETSQFHLAELPETTARENLRSLRVAYGRVALTEKLIATLSAEGQADRAEMLLTDPPYQSARNSWEASLVEAGQAVDTVLKDRVNRIEVQAIQGAFVLGSIMLSLSVIWIWGLFSVRNYNQHRDRVEAALRESEERFRALIGNIPVGIYRIKPGPSGEFIAANQAMTRMFGFETFEELVEGSRKGLYADEARRREFSEKLKREGRVVGAEIPLRGKDGNVLWGLISANLIRADDGRVLYIDGIAEDITDRKHATEAVQQSERLYRLLTENTRDVILTMDLSMRLTYVSPSCIHLLGTTPEETLAGRVEDFLTPWSYRQAREVLMEELQRARGSNSDTGRTRMLELKVQRKDGDTIWAEMRASFLKNDDGSPIGVQVSLRDITARRDAEQALRDSERLHRSIIETAEEGIWITDIDGRTAFVNRKMAEMLGYEVEEMIGRSAAEFMEEQSDTGAAPAPDRRGRSDLKLRRKNGGLFWASASESPMTDETGAPCGALRMIVDITDRRRAEEGSRILAATSSLFLYGKDINVAINTVLEMCGQFDRADRAHVFYLTDDQRHISNVYEWTAEGVEPCIDARGNIPIEDFNPMLERLALGESVGVPDVAAIPNARLRETLRSQQTASIILFPIFIHGEFEGFCGFETVRSIRDWSPSDTSVLRQISDLISRGVERKRAEAALQSSEALYTSLVEHLPQSVYRKDLQGRYTFVNSRFAELVGRGPERVIGSTDREIFPRDAAERYRAEDARVMDQGIVHEDIEERATPGGESRFLHVMKSPVRSMSGQIVGLQGIILDVTERRKVEEAVRAASRMEATATLAGGIAHDFNNLMVGILGNADLLKMKFGTDEAIARRLDIITTSAKRGGELAQKLLAFARGGQTQKHPMNLGSAIQEALDLQQRAIPSRIKVETEVEEKLWSVTADPAQMTQVLMNICLNAVEATEGEGKLLISAGNMMVDEAFAMAHRGLKPGPHVCLAVQDSGAGMSPQVRARVFEPFFTTKFQGRGLGLAAAHGIIRNHGGHITVYSEPGQGSVFRIYLPAIAPRKSAAAPTPAPIEKKPQPSVKPTETVLVIDDEEMVITVTRTMLERLGYTAITAMSGREAIELLRDDDRQIDVIILDLHMTDMTGPELFPILRVARPNAQIIICSGYERDEVSEGLLAQGARAYLNKPFRIDSLSREIRAALDTPGATAG